MSPLSRRVRRVIVVAVTAGSSIDMGKSLRVVTARVFFVLSRFFFFQPALGHHTHRKMPNVWRRFSKLLPDFCVATTRRHRV